MKFNLKFFTKILKARIILLKMFCFFLILFLISFKKLYLKLMLESFLFLFLGTKFVASKILRIPRLYDFKKFKLLINEIYPISILENIIFFYDPLAKKFFDSSHYYLQKYINLDENSIVIDAGAYIGAISVMLKSLVNTVYAFEPSKKNYKFLLKNINLNKNLPGKIIPINLALYSKKANLSFNQNGIISKIIEKGDKNNATTLDDFVKENDIKKIDFIKADLEGSEREFLQGAKNTLKNLQPSLAICSYHYKDDPIILKKLILDINPDYKIYQTKKILFAK